MSPSLAELLARGLLLGLLSESVVALGDQAKHLLELGRNSLIYEMCSEH